jgi:dipeptidyl aminopeptidase/acylaminoacyl peptidase
VEDALAADWAPNGRDLAVVRRDGEHGTWRLEFPIGTLLQESVAAVRKVRVSPRGDRLAFETAGAHELSVWSSEDGVTKVRSGIADLAWAPRSGELWYTTVSRGTTEIHALSAAGSDRLVASLPGDFALADVSDGGSVLLARVVESAEILESEPGKTWDRNLSNFDRSLLMSVSRSGDRVVFLELGMAGDRAGRALYVGSSDGSPPKKLGEFGSLDAALSPDGKYVLTAGSAESGLQLVPTGAGEAIPVPTDGLHDVDSEGFLPDGRAIYFRAAETGHRARVWVQDLASGRRRAVSPEGVGRPFVSTDGRFFCLEYPDGRWALYPAAGGDGEPVRGLESGEIPIRWTSDARGLYVRGDAAEGGESLVTTRVYRLDPWTGRRELWKVIPPVSPSTGGGISRILFADDGRKCFYTHHRWSSDLFLVDGLR